MAITTANLQCNLDSTNAASNTGSGNTWFDLSANNLDFTGTGTSRVTFNGNQVFDLGTGKYFNAANNLSAVIDWDADWTVELWINVDGSQTSTYHTPWGTGSNGSGAGGFNVQTHYSLGTRGYFQYTGGSYEITVYPAATADIPKDSTTIHQFVVRKSGGTVQFLLDGVPSYSRSGITNAISLNSDPFYIGYNVFYNAMIGKVAVLRVYDSALTNGEVLGNYSTTNFILNPPPSPVLDLNASESASYPGSGSTWFDITANNFDFTMYNPSFTPVSTDPAYFSFPSRNYTSPVTVYGEYNGTPAITSTNNFTGYFWVRRNADHGSFTQNRLSIFSNGREDLVGGDNGWSYGTYNNPNAANDNVVIERAGYGIIDSGYSFSDATWINIAITVDGSNTVTFYQDGVIKGGPGFSFSATTPADGMWISRTAGSFFSWMGDISIIRQYSTALTQAQIQQIYNYDLANYITPPTPPPTPYIGLVGGRTFGQGFAG